ncbi:MAG: histidine phosphatase family protein [Betaproteobacteria bacterium]|nr:MAG: histidine phosphatase family protein [Betaproteobacteria bacterium]
MPRLYFVRHARPSANWGEEPDAGLDATGLEQAEAAAQTLARTLQPMPIYTSPLRRCRETARPLEQLWQQTAQVLEAVAEIPSPPVHLRERFRWLKQAMEGTWQELRDSAPPNSPDYLGWRETLLSSLATMAHDSVIFSHYIAINVVVGAAQSRDEVVCFRPDHTSITSIEVAAQSVKVVELGRERDTTILTRG